MESNSTDHGMDTLEKYELGDGPDSIETQPLPETMGTEHAHPTHCSPGETTLKTSSSELDWDGPDDPENPHNWRFGPKVYHVTVPGLFGFAV